MSGLDFFFLFLLSLHFVRFVFVFHLCLVSGLSIYPPVSLTSCKFYLHDFLSYLPFVILEPACSSSLLLSFVLDAMDPTRFPFSPSLSALPSYTPATLDTSTYLFPSFSPSLPLPTYFYIAFCSRALRRVARWRTSNVLFAFSVRHERFQKAKIISSHSLSNLKLYYSRTPKLQLRKGLFQKKQETTDPSFNASTSPSTISQRQRSSTLKPSPPPSRPSSSPPSASWPPQPPPPTPSPPPLPPSR